MINRIDIYFMRHSAARRNWRLLLFFLCVFVLCSWAPPQVIQAESLILSLVRTELYFSPKGGAEAAIVRAIGQTKNEVCVLAYSFTSAPIDEALAAAHQRKVKIIVILDKSQTTARGGRLRSLQEAGVPVFIDSAHAIAHNKVMILDKHRVITGSFNFTRSAEERNAENLLIMTNRALSKKYLEDFARHLEHAAPADPGS
jgi:phosphatidylserine/phosphatidylglycerophosphate/cardiolipin synthase-like enzyme